MRNRHSSIFRLMLCLAITVVLLSALPASSYKAAAQGDNLLANPGFEGTYVQINGDPSLTVAPNWQPWFLGPPAGAPSSVNLRPDYQPASTNRVRSGSAAQEYNTFFATHDAGVFQRVPVTSGSDLKFSIFVYVWSSATFEDPNESISPQEMTVQVGIDPTGGTDPESASIVWSTAEEFYDEYRELSITTAAQGNAVTVYVRTNPQGAVGVNNVYVDDASLVVVGQPQPSTPASPTPEGGAGDDDDDDDDDDEATATFTATRQPTTSSGATATTTRTPTQTTVPDAVQQFPNRLTYTVVANDTVSGIAIRFNSTIAAIIAANGLDSNGFITIGQQLVIPVPAGQGQPLHTATPTITPTVPTVAPSATVPTGQPVTGTTPQPAPQNTPGIHVVQPGENLFRIALRYNTTVEALATLNNITNPNLIIVGTSLRVPVSGTPTTPPTTPGTGGAGTGTHLVQTGENAFRIALRYGVTVEELARVNNIANPNLIFAGQTLIIPH